MATILVRNIGRMSFLKALELQTDIAREILDKLAVRDHASINNTLLLVEHNPVYTIGIRRDSYSNDEVLKLKSLGADFVRTNRGGLITYHGPGQLVCYPVLYLGSFSNRKSMKWYIKLLEETVVDTCMEFGISANTCEHPGVWVANQKISSIGVHGTRYVTTHGVAVNCNVNLDWFNHIVPCGIPNKEVTSFSKVLHRNVNIQEVIPLFLKSFQNKFQCRLKYNNEQIMYNIQN